MGKFRVGDKVRIKRYCSGCKPGDICKLKYEIRPGDIRDTLFAVTKNGKGTCNCRGNWELISISKEIAKLKKQIKELENA